MPKAEAISITPDDAVRIIDECAKVWSDEKLDYLFAFLEAKHNPPQDPVCQARLRKNIDARLSRITGAVERACSMPIEMESVRDALERFADAIVERGSAIRYRDLAMIERRLKEKPRRKIRTAASQETLPSNVVTFQPRQPALGRPL